VLIDVWSDVVCPWCFIGKRRLERALVDFPHRDDVEVRWRSFQLDPTTPGFDPQRPARDVATELGAKYGGGREAGLAMIERVSEVARGDGLALRLADAVSSNTRAAHRLLHAALAEGGPAVQSALGERLFDAHFQRALDVADPAVLEAEAAAAGLDGQTARRVLAGAAYDDAVERDVDQARAYGATGVPFFVVDERYAISGAQPVEAFAQVLDRAWGERGVA
jgi:predicted DsbA family dithiol-disulfide isomerase